MRMSLRNFVVRSGSLLMLDGKPFRFAGPNIYWLGLDENVDGIDWPTEFRVLNALDTAVEMGASVIRSHTLGVSVGHPKSVQPVLGVMNEEAMRRIDFAVHAARERGLRLIIPLTDNWSYYHGGRETFARWRGLEDRNDFYTNSAVIGDFKAYISYIVNRINSYSGTAYKEDPAILAWELGNELNDAPVAWVEEIAAYIRSLDSNHLIAHGKQHKLDADKLAVANVDILDIHYYPANADELLADALAVQAAGKVYIAGEYGWPQGDLVRFLEAAEAEGAVSGTLFWSLFGHHDKYGYVQHFDGFSVHYPGSGMNDDVVSRISMMRAHAFRISGKEIAVRRTPEQPTLSQEGSAILFRGVVGAAYYTLENSTDGADGPWSVVYDRRPADHHMPWIDPMRAMSVRTWYRIKAINLDGAESSYSESIDCKPF
jgi:mannan endo-1,4-beta-mannosidase